MTKRNKNKNKKDPAPAATALPTTPPASTGFRVTRHTVCQVCERPAKPPNKLLKCSRCADGLGFPYCSKECQKIDWPKHKPHCDLFVSTTDRREIESLTSGSYAHDAAVEVHNNCLNTHLRLQLGMAVAAAYRAADPTSTLSETHLLVVDYNVDPRLQYHHQQVQFKKAVFWIKDEWIAKEMKLRNRSGDSQFEQMFRTHLTTDGWDPARRRQAASFVETGSRNITIVVHLILLNRDQEEEFYQFYLPFTIQFRRAEPSPRVFQFDNFNIPLDGVKIPLGLRSIGNDFARTFTAIYCHPELNLPPRKESYPHWGTHPDVILQMTSTKSPVKSSTSSPAPYSSPDAATSVRNNESSSTSICMFNSLIISCFRLAYKDYALSHFKTRLRVGQVIESWILIELGRNGRLEQPLALDQLFTISNAKSAVDRYLEMEFWENELDLRFAFAVFRLALSMAALLQNIRWLRLLRSDAVVPHVDLYDHIESGKKRGMWKTEKDWRIKIQTACDLFHTQLTTSVITLAEAESLTPAFTYFILCHPNPYRFVNLPSPPKAADPSFTFNKLSEDEYDKQIDTFALYFVKGGHQRAGKRFKEKDIHEHFYASLLRMMAEDGLL